MRHRNNRDDRIIKDFKTTSYYKYVKVFKEKHEYNEEINGK